MTVKADITSTLNGQTAELLLVEDSPDGTRKQQSRSLSGGTEALIFTSLDGGRDKRYTAKVIPSTTDVTQTSEIQFGAEIRIDPIPHRDSDATQKIRDGVEFNNGVAASQLGLGSSPLVSGLLTAALNDGEVLADDGSVHESVQAAQDAASSYIFIGPGTFNESVTIDTAGLTVQGSGYNTLISAGDAQRAIDSSANNVMLDSFRVTNDYTSSDEYAIRVNGDDTTVNQLWIEDVGRGLEGSGANTIINSVTVDTAQAWSIVTGKIITNCRVTNIALDSSRGDGIAVGDDAIIANNVVRDFSTSDSGIKVGSDCVVIGNRVHNISGGGGLEVSGGGADNIFANNRVSDCGTSIVVNGSAPLEDGNNTGASN